MSLFRYCFPAIALGSCIPLLAEAELAVTGVDRDIERNVRAFVSLAGENCESEDWLVRRRFRTLESEARKALEPFGFYDAVITSDLTIDEPCWRATIAIEPGDPVLYRDVRLLLEGAAAEDPAFEDLKEPRSLSPGAILKHADYERLKRAMQVRAADRGYIDAHFVENSLDVWPEQHAADVSLHFDSGPRYRIGEIRVDQSFLEPAIVDGYLDLERGALFDSADLARAHRDLSDSAYFGDIEILADLDNASNEEIPIQISLRPGTRIEYTVGIGASTDTGARFRAGFRNNRLNTRGHRLITDLGVSPVLQGLTAEYRIPLSDPRREWFSVTGALSNEETDTFDNDAQRLGLRWTKAMSDTWLRTLSLDASNESFAVGQDIDTTRFIVPGISFDQKISDRDVFPAYGRRLGAELRGTAEAIGSTTSYLQTTVWSRWIRSFGNGNRILARLNAGATSSKDFTRLPPSVRFFAGGDQSVRGYDYNSLGPKDSDGNVIGGSNLLVASLEYERHLRGNFFAAVFVDAGNAFDDTDFDPEVGAGFGLKWRSPLGPIRFYLGYPVTADDQSIRFHLRLGADL
jgi:translocation and assembly module TamA